MYWKIPRPKRFTKGRDFAPRGPRNCPRAKPRRTSRFPEGGGFAHLGPREIFRSEEVFPNTSLHSAADTIQWPLHTRMVRRCHSSASCDSNEPASQLASFTSVVTLPVIILIFTIILNWYYWSPKPQCSYVQLEVNPLSGKLLLFYSIEYMYICQNAAWKHSYYM